MLARFPAGWLLVFDNAPDLASVERFLPPAGPGRILITSQNPNWPHGQPLPVPVLDTDVTADFLVTLTSDLDQQAARELASELDGLPLALAQAAACILATSGTLGTYLALFKQRRPDVLRRGEPTGYTRTVATTWSLAFGRVEQSAPSAVGLLRLLACYAPQPVSLSLLLQPRPGLAARRHHAERAVRAVTSARWRCTVIGGQPRLSVSRRRAGLPAGPACSVNKPERAVRGAPRDHVKCVPKMADYSDVRPGQGSTGHGL